MGVLGGRRHDLGDRSQDLEGDQEDHASRCPACGPSSSSRSAWTSPRTASIVFVALGPANRVAVIDTATKEVKNYILVGQRPWHGEISPDGKKYYVANGLTNDLTVIDVESLKAEKSVPVGRLPWGVAIMPCMPAAASVRLREARQSDAVACLAYGLKPASRQPARAGLTACTNASETRIAPSEIADRDQRQPERAGVAARELA